MRDWRRKSDGTDLTIEEYLEAVMDIERMEGMDQEEGAVCNMSYTTMKQVADLIEGYIETRLLNVKDMRT